MTDLAVVGGQTQALADAQAQAHAKIAQHSSASNEHFTPRAIVEAARELMGGIDLDPFSCAAANKIVRAASFVSLPQDAFQPSVSWGLGQVVRDDGRTGSRVFCNPPGGKLDRKTLKPTKGAGYSSAGVAWARFVHEWQQGTVEQGLFVGFNLEILRTSQGWVEHGIPGCSSFPCCFPKDRLGFWNEDKAEEDSDPTCANVLVYVPPRRSPGQIAADTAEAQRFSALFSPFGEVKL